MRAKIRLKASSLRCTVLPVQNTCRPKGLAKKDSMARCMCGSRVMWCNFFFARNDCLAIQSGPVNPKKKKEKLKKLKTTKLKPTNYKPNTHNSVTKCF